MAETLACRQLNSDHNWIQDLADLYQEYLVDSTNPIVMNWPMVSRDRLNVGLIFAYALFVLWLGPKMMARRKAYDLRWLMIPYNAALVVANFYIFMEYLKVRVSGGIETSCNTLEFNNIDNPNTYRLAEITWYFYLTKYVELCDTIFFVLRKKDRQLSKLHLVHHTTVPLIIWGLLRSEPGGYNSFFPLANAFVHCVMYTYYGISAIGDDVQVHLKFKKYVTMTQMIQFILVLYYFFSRPLYGCVTSKRAFTLNIFIAGFFFILFANFYWNEYMTNLEARQKQLQHNGSSKKAQ